MSGHLLRHVAICLRQCETRVVKGSANEGVDTWSEFGAAIGGELTIITSRSSFEYEIVIKIRLMTHWYLSGRVCT
jgi:hypothetical protein